MNDMTNPKDLLGVKKVALGLLPVAGVIYGALAMALGAVKYGAYNWRTKHVRMTVYLNAIERHLAAVKDGEWLDPESGKPHLGHVIACAAILADAKEGNFLIDDRPPPGPGPKLLAEHVTGRTANGADHEAAAANVAAVREAAVALRGKRASRARR